MAGSRPRLRSPRVSVRLRASAIFSEVFGRTSPRRSPRRSSATTAAGYRRQSRSVAATLQAVATDEAYLKIRARFTRFGPRKSLPARTAETVLTCETQVGERKGKVVSVRRLGSCDSPFPGPDLHWRKGKCRTTGAESWTRSTVPGARSVIRQECGRRGGSVASSPDGIRRLTGPAATVPASTTILTPPSGSHVVGEE